VFEAEHGEVVSVAKIRKQLPVEEYLRPQRRFAHLFSPKVNTAAISRIQAMADRNIRKYQLIEK
jgi:pyruvate ferredoxin oxidoreductase beta subunit